MGRFYSLPKIHKEGCPGRPLLISDFNTATERILQFVDHHLRPLVLKINFCMKMQTTFLKE